MPKSDNRLLTKINQLFIIFCVSASRWHKIGGIAQLGERLHGMQEVRSSILLVSTKLIIKESV